jgi:hypothetical protein
MQGREFTATRPDLARADMGGDTGVRGWRLPDGFVSWSGGIGEGQRNEPGRRHKAAEAAGVSDRTLRTWLGKPAFVAAYREARRQVVEHAVARL